MDGPDSSYSCFEIHISWKVDRDARIEPPIHTEYFLSGGAMTLTFIPGGTSDVISFCIRSDNPGRNIIEIALNMMNNENHFEAIIDIKHRAS